MAGRGAPRRWRYLAGATLLGAALAAAPRSASAGAPATPGGTPGPPVAVTLPPPSSPARALILLVIPAGDAASFGERAAANIAAHLRPLGVELAVVRDPEALPSPAPEPPAIAARSRQLVGERGARGVLWVVLDRDGGALSLFLYAPDGERLFERKLSAPKGQTSAAVEALALIAEAASAELLEGKVATMTRVADAEPTLPAPTAASAPPPAEPPEPPEPAPAAESVAVSPGLQRAGADHLDRAGDSGSAALAAGYVGNTAGRTLTWQSAFAVEAGWHPTPRATLGLGYEIALPDAAAGGLGGPQLHRHPVFAAGGYRVLFLPRWDVELGGRAVADFITLSGGRMFGSSPVRGSLGPTADLGLRVLPPLRLGLRLGVDVMLDGAGGAASWSASDQVRFAGGLGLQLDLDPSKATARKTPRLTASR